MINQIQPNKTIEWLGLNSLRHNENFSELD